MGDISGSAKDADIAAATIGVLGVGVDAAADAIDAVAAAATKDKLGREVDMARDVAAVTKVKLVDLSGAGLDAAGAFFLETMTSPEVSLPSSLFLETMASLEVSGVSLP